MPSVEDNLKLWNSVWENEGEEWSTPFGSSKYQWFCTLYPRIMHFIANKGHILEIASGYGRWTKYLLDNCNKLSAVDLSPSCIEGCKKKFDHFKKASFYLNDGVSLDMIEDNSLDFVFSFDSLVHADETVIKNYLLQLFNKMKPGAYGFIHHSNHGIYTEANEIKVDQATIAGHWRDTKMSARKFRQFCKEAGLKCQTQELVTWSSDQYIDCYSLFFKDDNINDVKTSIFYTNSGQEQSYVKNIYTNYQKYVPISEFSSLEYHLNTSYVEKNISNIAEKYKNKKICFYGSGKIAQKLVSQLDLSILNIDSFIDADISKRNTKIGNYTIKHVDDLKTINPNVLILSVLEPEIIIYSLVDKLFELNIKPKIIHNFLKEE